MTIFIILLGMVSIKCALPNKSVSQSKWFNFPKLSPLKLTPQKHISIHKIVSLYNGLCSVFDIGSFKLEKHGNLSSIKTNGHPVNHVW